jgi:hypothetical protein
MLHQGRRIQRWAERLAVLALCLPAGISGLASAAPEPALGARTAHRMSGPPGKPAYLWLWYADGGPLPETPPACFDVKPPPAFKCNYGTTLADCQQQVQTYLDAWYSDFNLVFTLTRPTGKDYYALMITSNGSWCPDTSTGTSTEAGIANFSYCNDNSGAAALIFACGYSAHACATTIAHEHGHLVGLEHTISTTDVMNSTVLATAAGFADESLRTPIEDSHTQCSPTQNSYQRMLATLGPWTAGAKPSLFAKIPDAGAPDLPASDSGDTPSGGGSGGGSVGPLPPPSDVDGGVAVVPGFDVPGLVRPPLPTADASVQTSQKHGGCNLAGGAASTSATVAVLLLALALLASRAIKLGWFAARARRVASRRP